MKKVFNINQMKKVNKGAKKKSIEIRIFLDTDSVFYEGERIDEGQERLINKILQARLYRAKLENGYIEDNQENRGYLNYLQTYER
jgi:hypothetical protein